MVCMVIVRAICLVFRHSKRAVPTTEVVGFLGTRNGRFTKRNWDLCMNKTIELGWPWYFERYPGYPIFRARLEEESWNPGSPFKEHTYQNCKPWELWELHATNHIRSHSLFRDTMTIQLDILLSCHPVQLSVPRFRGSHWRYWRYKSNIRSWRASVSSRRSGAMNGPWTLLNSAELWIWHRLIHRAINS